MGRFDPSGSRRGQRYARLADAACADDRHDRVFAEEGFHGVQIFRPTKERRRVRTLPPIVTGGTADSAAPPHSITSTGIANR